MPIKRVLILFVLMLSSVAFAISCDELLEDGAPNSRYDRKVRSWLGPALSPGTYYAGYAAWHNSPLNMNKRLGHLRDKILQARPQDWRWRGQMESQTLHSQPYQGRRLEMTLRLNQFLRFLAVDELPDSKAIASLRRIKAGIVFLADIYPEVHDGILDLIVLSKVIPKLETMPKPLELDPAKLKFDSRRTPQFAVLCSAALLDIYFYGIARYARETRVDEENPLSKYLISYFKQAGWVPVDPTMSLVDLEFLSAVHRFKSLQSILDSRDQYLTLIRRLALSKQGRNILRDSLPEIMKRSEDSEWQTKADDVRNPYVSPEILGIVMEIDSISPGSDLTLDEMKGLLAMTKSKGSQMGRF